MAWMRQPRSLLSLTCIDLLGVGDDQQSTRKQLPYGANRIGGNHLLLKQRRKSHLNMPGLAFLLNSTYKSGMSALHYMKLRVASGQKYQKMKTYNLHTPPTADW